MIYVSVFIIGLAVGILFERIRRRPKRRRLKSALSSRLIKKA